MEDLNVIISNLIKSKDEGGYWDFKEFWEEESKISDLLHDIICMANNLEDRDSYIIYGVRNKTFEISGIENTPNRRNRQNVIDFLKDKHFAGGIKPTIDLQCINLENHELDILIIKNTYNTPYFLEEKYKDVQSNLIYTRIKDTNTPKDKNADIDKIEYLWKKRFGLTKSGIEQFEKFLEDYENWEKDLGNKNYMFYKSYPEYKIHLTEINQCKEPICDFYTNEFSTIYKANFLYNSTILYTTFILAVDEFRKFIVFPKTGLYNDSDINSLYYYYLLDSIDGKLLKVITDGTYDLKSREYHNIPILLFNSESEKKSYLEFSKENKQLDLSTEIDNFKNYFPYTQTFSNKHIACIKSYILYELWIKSENIV